MSPSRVQNARTLQGACLTGFEDSKFELISRQILNQMRPNFEHTRFILNSNF